MILNDTTATASTNPQGLIQRAWLEYKGNTSWPASGSANYLRMVAIANSLKNQWALDSKVRWDSLFSQNNSVGTVSNGVQAYALPTNVFFLSDYVYVKRTDGNSDRFRVIHPETRNDANNATGSYGGDSGDPPVYLTGSYKGGSGGLTLNFVNSFSTNQLGGTITAGTYVCPADMVNNSDVVPVDNPEWLVYALAAEMARNDPAKEDQYPNLQGTANDLYNKMVKANEGNSWQQPNSPEYVLQNPGISWGQF